MGRRGPPPKPTALRLVQGNPSKKPLPKNEPKPASAAPPVPAFLDEYGREEWQRVVPELLAIGCLAEIDAGALAVYCMAFSRWRHLEDVLKKLADQQPNLRGLTSRNAAGGLAPNPLVGMANKQMMIVLRAAAEFGMTPSARTRIQTLQQDTARVDPAERFFDRIG